HKERRTRRNTPSPPSAASPPFQGGEWCKFAAVSLSERGRRRRPKGEPARAKPQGRRRAVVSSCLSVFMFHNGFLHCTVRRSQRSSSHPSAEAERRNGSAHFAQGRY